MSDQRETITLGGGCFWCVEAVMQPLHGVREVVSGYAGGDTPDPTYRAVCSGSTGHAEVVQVTFDPKILSLQDLLMIFFTTHDPTTLNRQGADRGTQYRSIVLYETTAQKNAVEAVMEELGQEGVYDDPIVTQVEPLETFYRAEEKHQNYFRRNPYQPYCMAVIAPKVSKLRKQYLDRLKPEAT